MLVSRPCLGVEMGGKAAGEMREAILGLMRGPGYGPATLRDLIRQLRVPRERRNEFKRVLREMLSEEEVARVDRKRYAAATGVETVTGRLQRNPRGFGFVTPDRGGRDIFVPARGIGDLMDGDRVALRVVREGAEGRTRGEVLRVLERSGRRVVGIYRSRGGARGPGTVEAFDRLFEAGILVPEGAAGPAEDGMVVGVEITRPPGEGRPATGRVVERLGHPDGPGTDLRAIVLKYDLREEFPADVLDQIEPIPDRVTAGESASREDFRELPIVTIDGETAMDFDDAVCVRRAERGAYELQVHIADVAHYVTAGTPLDREAYERGTSVYFPGTAIPMLPHKLSGGICSLKPGVDRLVQSCLMTIDRGGEVASYRFAQGIIRSAARMTYTDVAKILVDRDPGVSERHRALVPTFRLMEELCGVLNERRRRRGSIDFDLPEPELILAATGEMTGIVALQRNVAHRLIEEFMLAANETVARHLFKARVPSMYRIHERPDPKRVADFDRVAQAFGYGLPPPFESIEPAAFQAMTAELKGKPEERFLSRLMLRAMKQARYSEARDIHFGLATSCYTHFTSPIRRYPDLVVHRILKRVLHGGPMSPGERRSLEAFLPEAALHASRMERNADAAENEMIAWKQMAFMSDRLGEEFEAFIVAVHPYGFFAELDDLFVDGLVRHETLADDRYRFHERKQILKGERHGRVFKLGDRVRVRVDRVNRFLLQIDFSLAGQPSPAHRGRKAGGGRRASGGGRPRR